MSKISVKVVIGSNYGDEGKGMVSCLFSANAGHCLNVLFNGGHQRGHTVELRDGTRHVFHHFGSGTFVGADTYFDDNFMVSPIAFMFEANELKVFPRCFISPKCRVITPYDAFINQIVEEKRGNARHGSCGCGIWETKVRYSESDYNLPYLQLTYMDDDKLLAYLHGISSEYVPKRLKSYGIKYEDIPERYKKLFESCLLAKAFIRDFRKMQELVSVVRDFDNFARTYDTIVFEAGQGLALSESEASLYPYVTASNTTSMWPMSRIANLDCDVEVCYVTRSYFTRHGAGPLPTECSKDEINKDIVDLTNVPNEFQKTIRYGKFDTKEFLKRVNPDIAIVKIRRPKAKISLFITHINYYGNLAIGDFLKYFDKFYLSSTKYYDDVYRCVKTK